MCYDPDQAYDLLAYAEDNRATLVYVAINSVNGKRYIGLTRLTLEKRRTTHLYHARKGRRGKFYSALRKHGPRAFQFSVLCFCETYQEACAAERRMVFELSPEYNMTAGGEGILGYRPPPSVRAKMSAAKAGRAPWAKGECPSDIRAKLSASAKARKGREAIVGKRLAAILANAKRANDRRRRPVVCLTDGKAFASATHAAEHYGYCNTTVLNLCNGRHKNSKINLKFAYVEDTYET